jgi:hypothetical protein
MRRRGGKENLSFLMPAIAKSEAITIRNESALP